MRTGELITHVFAILEHFYVDIIWNNLHKSCQWQTLNPRFTTALILYSIMD